MNPKTKKILIWVGILLLVALLIYFLTYFLAKKNNKVIYQKDNKRIYLNDKKEYKPGRIMWRMVYEDKASGNRIFILGNSKKGFSDKKMAAIVMNTLEKGKMRSFDSVESAGVTMRDAKTDMHSNLVEKKNPLSFLPEMGEFDMSDFKL